jgi:hypothetical protein
MLQQSSVILVLLRVGRVLLLSLAELRSWHDRTHGSSTKQHIRRLARNYHATYYIVTGEDID